MRSTIGFPGKGNRSHTSTCISTRSLWLCYFRNLVLFQQQRQQQQQGGNLCRSYSSCVLRSSSWSKKDRQATRQWLLRDIDHQNHLIHPHHARLTFSTATVTSSFSSSTKEISPSSSSSLSSSAVTDTTTLPHPRWFNSTNDIDHQLQLLKTHRQELDDAFIFKTLRSLLFNVSQHKHKLAWMIYEAMVEHQVVDHLRANHYGVLLNIIKYAPNATPQLLAIMEQMKLAEQQGRIVIEARHYSQIMFGMSRQADVKGICEILRTLARHGDGSMLQASWYTSLAMAAKRKGHLPSSLTAAQLMDQAMKKGVVLEQRACVMMIAALSKDMDAVARFLTTMKESGMMVLEDDNSTQLNNITLEINDSTKQFNVNIYTSLISGLAQKGDQVNARKVWKMMRENKLRPTTATYTAMVEAYGKAGNIKAAMSLMKKYTFINKGQLNKVMATSVLVNSIRHKRLDHAQELIATWVNKMGLTVDKKMDPEFWSAVIWVKVLEDVEMARGFYESLYKQNSNYVDAVMVNHLVSGYGDARKKQQVLDSFALHENIPPSSSGASSKSIHRRDPVDPYFYLVDSLFKCRDVPAALSALAVMRRHSIPDDITMAMVVRGLVMNEENELAWQLFQTLKFSGLEPNMHAYTSILKTCIKGGKRGATKQQSEHNDQPIPADILESSLGITNTSSVATGLLGDKTIGPNQAYIMFRKMTGYNKPNVYTYTTLIACFAKHNIGRAVTIFAHMCKDGVEPVMQTYVALLQGCAIFRNAPMAMMVLQHMQERKKHHLIPNPQICHYLLKALVRARLDKKKIDQFGDMVRAHKQQTL
ncbi:hypothetical protein BC941DRAFT_418415 [Chlamydoabsidia padenii]|nr:hypothetical protein BC941DRAFT_418415 [Chlamydoabsidia padenii]